MKPIFTLYLAWLLPFFLSGQQFSIIELTSEPGTNYFNLSNLYSSAEMNGKLYFDARALTGSGFWKTDGTTQGTSFLFPFTTVSLSPVYQIYAHKNSLYIMGREHIPGIYDDDDPYGIELWKSDGTTGGTIMLKDIVPGKVSGWPTAFTSVGNQLFFAAYNSSFEQVLWKTDGTEAGTTMVKDIKIDGDLFHVKSMIAWNNELYFAANDSVKEIELWKSDGTEAGTVLVRDIIPGSGSSEPRNLTIYNNNLYFSANNGNGRQLFVTDGTETGTVLVKNINTGNNPDVDNLIVCKNLLFFTANDGIYGRELWVSDGTENGTKMVKDIHSGSEGSIAQYTFNLVASENILYFTANDGIHGGELWKTDGTEAGTMMVIDLYSGANSSEIKNMCGYNGNVYFSAREDSAGFKIIRSDGTESGTSVFAPPGATNDYPAGTAYVYFEATVFNNSLLLEADYFGEGSRLWRYGDPISSTPELVQNTLHIYPNPATNHLRIDLGKIYSDITLEVHNINGQLIERKNLQSVQQHGLNISQWSKGLYLISMISKEKMVNGKLIKQ